jgi:hypothetical protein
MRKVFITLAASLAVGWFLASNGQFTFLLPGSQLGFLESRIEGPASEMMRRSPELRANFEKFQTCYKSTPRCDTTAIFAERDRLVKQLWPEILNRLEVAQDWDVCDDPALHCESINVERDTFFQVQAVFLWSGILLGKIFTATKTRVSFSTPGGISVEPLTSPTTGKKLATTSDLKPVTLTRPVRFTSYRLFLYNIEYNNYNEFRESRKSG